VLMMIGEVFAEAEADVDMLGHAHKGIEGAVSSATLQSVG
jgi:hypothetical protein